MKSTLFSILLCMSFISPLASQTYEELVKKSADYIGSNDYLSAEQTLKNALRMEPANPGNILLLSNLGTIQRKLGKFDEAMISYNTALSKYPNMVSVLHNRAALLCEMDSISLAKKDYETILLLDKENEEATYRMALIYMNENNLLAAENMLSLLDEINPDNNQSKMVYALIYKKQNNWVKAESFYTDLIFKNKTNSSLYVDRAECYLHLKKLARAQSDLNKAQELGNSTAFFHIIKGQLNLQQFDHYAAKQEFLKAKELGADSDMIAKLIKLCK